MIIETNSKIFLILGCQRSGTSLLTSLMGAHSDINMLYESRTKDPFHLIGKKYGGNKLVAWRQVRLKTRASIWGHLINRIANMAFTVHKYHKRRPYPASRLSLQDYLDRDSKFIIITRDEEETVKSMVKRTALNERQARREYQKAMKVMSHVSDVAFHVSFHDLVTDPEQVLRGICGFLDIEFEKRMLEGPKYNYVYPHEKILAERSSQSKS